MVPKALNSFCRVMNPFAHSPLWLGRPSSPCLSHLSLTQHSGCLHCKASHLLSQLYMQRRTCQHPVSLRWLSHLWGRSVIDDKGLFPASFLGLYPWDITHVALQRRVLDCKGFLERNGLGVSLIHFFFNFFSCNWAVHIRFDLSMNVDPVPRLLRGEF